MTSSERTLADYGPAGRALERTVLSGRISPSYLLEGSDADDLGEVALAFAVALLGGREPGPRGARVRRLVAQDHHPDLHRVQKDKPSVISVASLAAHLEEAHQKPLEGARQVFLIEPADAMENAGIARYLKALEEPPEGTVFVLVSMHPDRLPATVLSRVRRVRFPPVPPDAIADRLVQEGIRAERPARLARWGGGSLARARRIATDALDDAARRLAEAGLRGGEVAGAVGDVLAHVDRVAVSRAEAAGTDAPETKRQHVRGVLSDLITLLAVEARDAAATRRGESQANRRPDPIVTVDPEAALVWLERLGSLSAAVHANVTPAVILLELTRTLATAASGHR
ncbi:MAG: hypothetical protein ACC662_01250 [Planctomycetota bacterium]